MLDLLRAVATLRVVTYHATGDPHWSWFAAMPLMFFIGGALYAQSLDRRPWRTLLPERLRRILIPWWAWVALVFGVYTIAGVWGQVPWWGIPGFLVPILPAVGPRGASGPYYWTWMALWYLNAYIVFMLIGIPFRRWVQRRPRLVVGLLLVPSLVSGILQEPAIGAVTSSFAFWVLGYTYHDGTIRIRRPVTGLALFAGGTAVAIAYAELTTGTKVVLTGIPFLSVVVGLAWLGLAGAIEPWVDRVMAVRLIAYPVEFLKQRALTVYLWHAAAVGLCASLLGVSGPGVTEWVPRIALVYSVTFLIVLATGWIEDVAARRPARVWPNLSGAVVHPELVVDLRSRRSATQRRDIAESQVS
jgi:hypothetical protein